MADKLTDAFLDFLRLEVADGDASPDTVRGYSAQVRLWLCWCRQRGLDPLSATPEAIKKYGEYLLVGGYRPSSISFKLSILRRLYEAAVAQGLRSDNPAAKVRPPRSRKTW
jgi:site-specific recombinase XerD